MKLKKQEDGKYYEKIVTWKKRKSDNVTLAFAFLLLGSSAGFVMGWIGGVNDGDNLLISFLVIFGFAIFFFVINFFESHEKIVKFRRIRK